MDPHHSPLNPEAWLHNVFATKQVQQGGVIRRKTRDVERYCGMEVFRAEVRRRGYQVVENGGQFIIFCNRDPIKRIV